MKEILRSGADAKTALKAAAASQADVNVLGLLAEGPNRKGILASIKAKFRRIKSRTKRSFIKKILLEVEELKSQLRHVLGQQDQILEQQEQILKQISDEMASLGRINEYTLQTARRSAIYCGNETTLVRSVSGYVLCEAHDYALLATLIEAGELEPGTRLLIERYLQPGDCFVDVGANIGLLTLAAARRMGGVGKIIAFEPFEKTKQLLEKTLWINGVSSCVDIHQAAVTNETGQKKLYLGQTCGHHSLFAMEKGGAHVEVALMRLDDVIPNDQQIDLLKIDAEGAELEVIASGVERIKESANIAIIAEFGPEHLQKTGIIAHDWLEKFTELGFEYRVIDPVSGALNLWSPDENPGLISANIFFYRPGANRLKRLQ